MPVTRISKHVILAIVALAAACLMAGPSQAQITRTARIELDNNTKELYFGSDVYITFDKDQRLNEKIVATRHENNLRGMRQDSDIVNLGVDPGPTWLVFSVTNNSDREDWVLDFGTPGEGRMGMVRKLMVMNSTSGEVFVRAMREEGKPGALGETLSGTAVPVRIGTGKSELFVVYLETAGNMAATFAPRLMSPQEQMNGFTLPKTGFMLLLVFLIAAATFFAGAAYLEKKPVFCVFSAYYALNILMFLLQRWMFFVPFLFGGEAASMLFPACFLAGLALTWIFIDISAEDYSDTAIIISLGSFIVVSALIAVVLPDAATAFNEILVFLPSAIGMLGLAGLAFSHAQRGKFAGYYLASGWLMPFIGASTAMLSAGQILGSNAFLLNAYWISLLPQALFFSGGVAKKIQESRAGERAAISRESRAAQSLARLKQSKETADQARLLRVIERERELMAELREQEMQRTEEMRRAKEMADQANRAKSAFLAVVSHEIRTPMTGIMGILRLLKETKMSKEQSEYLLTIQKSGDTMMTLLNDILDFEKIESGNMKLEEIDFDIPKLVQGVVTLMSGHAADRHVTLQADIPSDFPPSLAGDPTRLRQVLLNLVNNAIKFTENGRITIRIRATKLENKKPGIKGDYEIYFAVEDTGIGISEKAQEKLFTPFEQADASVSRKYGGTGLGLAICRKLVTAMGGTISLTSQVGVGSTFFFSLLMKEGRQSAAEEGEPAALSAPAAGPPLRILVIEDNEINRKVMQNFLEKQNHEVSLADSGEMGLDLFGRGSFDVIFTDINLTGMNGMEVARTIRLLPDRRAAATPIIALTGNVAEKDVQAFYDAGINEFLAKPINYDRLLALLGDVRNGLLRPKSKITYDGEEDQEGWLQPRQDKKDSETTLLHQFLQDQEKNPKTAEDFGAIFDSKMLDGLSRSLGKEQTKELLDGFISKTDEIVAALQESAKAGDGPGLYERAHELKGMSANFGMKGLAQIAATIEKAAQNKKMDIIPPEIEKLPGAAQQTREAIRSWLG